MYKADEIFRSGYNYTFRSVSSYQKIKKSDKNIHNPDNKLHRPPNSNLVQSTQRKKFHRQSNSESNRKTKKDIKKVKHPIVADTSQKILVKMHSECTSLTPSDTKKADHKNISHVDHLNSEIEGTKNRFNRRMSFQQVGENSLVGVVDDDQDSQSNINSFSDHDNPYVIVVSQDREIQIDNETDKCLDTNR